MATQSKSVASKGKVTSTTRRVKTTTPTKPVISKAQAADLDEKNVKDTIKQAVTSIRDVKWKYPEDITGPIERKTWRAKQRRALNSLELKVSKEKDTKEKDKLTKELTKLRKEVLLVP